MKRIIKPAGILLLSMGIAACEVSDADGNDPTSGRFTTGSVFNDSSVSQIGNPAALPKLTNIIASQDTTLGLSLVDNGEEDLGFNGQPPSFASISSTETNSLFIGNLDSLHSETLAARNAATWATVEANYDVFEEASTKCFLMAEAAEKLNHVGEAMRTSCQMQKIDNEENGLLEWIDGDAYTPGKVFEAAEDGKVIVVDLVESTSELETVKSNTGTVLPSNREERSIFHIAGAQESGSTYSATVYRCERFGDGEWAPIGTDKVTIDNESGKFTLSSVYGNKYEKFENDDPNAPLEHRHEHKHKTTVNAYLSKSGEGENGFDLNQSRSFIAEFLDLNENRDHKTEERFRSFIEVSGNDLFFKNHGYHEHEQREPSSGNVQHEHSDSHKETGILKYTGTNWEDVAFYAGAGRRKFTFENTEGGSTDTHSEESTVYFTYDEDASPKYKGHSAFNFASRSHDVDWDQDDHISGENIDDPKHEDELFEQCNDPGAFFEVNATYVLDFSLSEVADEIAECDKIIDDNVGEICTDVEAKRDDFYKWKQEANAAN